MGSKLTLRERELAKLLLTADKAGGDGVLIALIIASCFVTNALLLGVSCDAVEEQRHELACAEEAQPAVRRARFEGGPFAAVQELAIGRNHADTLTALLARVGMRVQTRDEAPGDQIIRRLLRPSPRMAHISVDPRLLP